MRNGIKVKRAAVRQLVEATFPEYTGLKFRIEAAESVTLYDLNYSGGTRNQYRGCLIDGTPAKRADHFNQCAPWNNPAEGAIIPLPEGAVIVEHSMFCGSDTGLTFYVNPANMPRLLPGRV
jgi:hypothetical protein